MAAKIGSIPEQSQHYKLATREVPHRVHRHPCLLSITNTAGTCLTYHFVRPTDNNESIRQAWNGTEDGEHAFKRHLLYEADVLLLQTNSGLVCQCGATTTFTEENYGLAGV